MSLQNVCRPEPAAMSEKNQAPVMLQLAGLKLALSHLEEVLMTLEDRAKPVLFDDRPHPPHITQGSSECKSETEPAGSWVTSQIRESTATIQSIHNRIVRLVGQMEI